MKNAKLENALYSGHSIPEVITIYSNSLRKNGNIADIAHANKLLEYKNSITNKNLLYRMRKNFNGIFTLIDKEFPEMRFIIDGRQKSLLSTEAKIKMLLSENRSLDLLRDVFAFRIILFGKNSINLINQCYYLANKIIEFNLAKGITLCEADEVSNTASDLSDSGIIIPKKSKIIKPFKYGVKDYILNPKTNGYQSLHILFRATTGETFEIQIRTFDMHVFAETGNASHSQYKVRKYETLDFDKSKIEIPGFGVSPDGKQFDFIGLQEGLEILKRQKTY